MKWYPFDKAKGSRQKRPPEKRYVLVRLERTARGNPEAIAIGYRKNSAGDKQCPYFVIPGLGGDVVGWCDCLPEDVEWWLESQQQLVNAKDPLDPM